MTKIGSLPTKVDIYSLQPFPNSGILDIDIEQAY